MAYSSTLNCVGSSAFLQMTSSAWRSVRFFSGWPTRMRPSLKATDCALGTGLRFASINGNCGDTSLMRKFNPFFFGSGSGSNFFAASESRFTTSASGTASKWTSGNTISSSLRLMSCAPLLVWVRKGTSEFVRA